MLSFITLVLICHRISLHAQWRVTRVKGRPRPGSTRWSNLAFTGPWARRVPASCDRPQCLYYRTPTIQRLEATELAFREDITAEEKRERRTRAETVSGRWQESIRCDRISPKGMGPFERVSRVATGSNSLVDEKDFITHDPVSCLPLYAFNVINHPFFSSPAIPVGTRRAFSANSEQASSPCGPCQKLHVSCPLDGGKLIFSLFYYIPIGILGTVVTRTRERTREVNAHCDHQDRARFPRCQAQVWPGGVRRWQRFTGQLCGHHVQGPQGQASKRVREEADWCRDHLQVQPPQWGLWQEGSFRHDCWSVVPSTCNAAGGHGADVPRNCGGYGWLGWSIQGAAHIQMPLVQSWAYILVFYILYIASVK